MNNTIKIAIALECAAKYRETGGNDLMNAVVELRRLAAVELELEALKASLGEPVAWTDEQMIQFGWMLLCQVNQDDSLEKRLETFRKIMVARNTPHPIKQGPVQEPVGCMPIETAPKDSSMLRLLVNFDDHSLEDCNEPCWTIGTNALSDTGVDEWLFAGWDWTHDRFTQGTGTPIGWLPMLYTSPQAAQPLSDQEIADAAPVNETLAHGFKLGVRWAEAAHGSKTC